LTNKQESAICSPTLLLGDGSACHCTINGVALCQSQLVLFTTSYVIHNQPFWPSQPRTFSRIRNKYQLRQWQCSVWKENHRFILATCWRCIVVLVEWYNVYLWACSVAYERQMSTSPACLCGAYPLHFHAALSALVLAAGCSCKCLRSMSVSLCVFVCWADRAR